jgi:hypothetical protein
MTNSAGKEAKLLLENKTLPGFFIKIPTPRGRDSFTKELFGKI